MVSQEDLQRTAPIAISEALTQMPSFRIASSPVTANTFADLRRVGAQRTLVLIDGRRHVPSQSNGTVDLNVVPAAMVERTELVTGGASASWGSDAVSGVVNIVLRKDLEGFIGNVQGGISKYDDNESLLGSFAFGHKLGERTHLLIGAEYANSEGVGSTHPPEFSRPWGASGSVGNTSTTNGLPGTIYASDVRRSTLSPGGLIISVPLTATNPNLVALRGLQFLPNGQTAPFGFGQVFGNRMIGGTDNVGEYTNVGGAVKYPLERYTMLAHVDHDLTDNTRLFFEGTFAHSITDGTGNPARNEGTTPFGATPTCSQDATAPAGGRFRTTSATSLGAITVGIDNPYLPASVRTLMQGGGINCFSMGRSWREPGLGEFQAHDGVPKMLRGAVGGSGKLAGSWSWDAYFQSGRTEYNTIRKVQPQRGEVPQFDGCRGRGPAAQRQCATTASSAASMRMRPPRTTMRPAFRSTCSASARSRRPPWRISPAHRSSNSGPGNRWARLRCAASRSRSGPGRSRLQRVWNTVRNGSRPSRIRSPRPMAGTPAT